MNRPTVFVHEYVTGGGFADFPLPASLSAEGDAMLQAVIEDFRSWGQVRVITTRDQRLDSRSPAADKIIPLTPHNFARGFAALAQKADACLVIAPEEQGILEELSETVLHAGSRLLGSMPCGIRVAGDKWRCHTYLQHAGLPLPLTVRAPAGKIRQTALEFGFPLVLKTIDGQGSLGVCLATDSNSLDKALEYLPHSVPLLLQRYHHGVHASVSLLATRTDILPLCVNRQHIVPGIPFSYQGGESPFLEHPAINEALALAKAAVRAIPGLQGFVGVDVVFNTSHCLLVEVNPRVTVAYSGVRRILDCNLAQALYNSCIFSKLPQEINFTGSTAFTPREIVHA